MPDEYRKHHVEKSVDNFTICWNNCKNNNRKFVIEVCIKQHLFEHFGIHNPSDFLEEVEIVFIGQTYPKDP